MNVYIIGISIIFLCNQCYSQKIGIGTNNPNRAIVEENAQTMTNLTNAIFGSTQSGISLQQNPSTIGFNQYLDNGNSFVSRWMSNGYGLRQQFDKASGIMTWKFLRNGIAENIVVASDEKIGMQLNYNGINNSTGLGINRAPLTSFHVLYKDPNVPGTGAGFTPYGIAGFESNIDAFINVMSPIGYQNGLLMGSPINAIRGGVIYSHNSNPIFESLALRTGGNFNRFVISASGNVAIGDFIATNKLDIDGAISCSRQDIDFNTSTYMFSTDSWDVFSLNLNNSSYIRITNTPETCCQFIGRITPGTKVGQLLTIEIIDDLEGLIEHNCTDCNLILPNVSILVGPETVIKFIWNGTDWVTYSVIQNN